MNKSEVTIAQKIFDAPLEDVWDAWADPEKLAGWWRVSTVKEMVITEYEFRPGGTWRQHALSHEGFAIGEHNPGVMFKEIVPLEKIVTVPNPIDGESVEIVPDLEETVISFERVGDAQTKVTVKVVRNGSDEWQPNELQQSVYDEVFDNLAKYLLKT